MTTTQILLGYLACGLALFLFQMPMVWRMYRESMAAAVEQITARAAHRERMRVLREKTASAYDQGLDPELKERFDTVSQQLSEMTDDPRFALDVRPAIRKILLVSLVPGFFIALFLWPVTMGCKVLAVIFGWKEPEGPDAIEMLQGEN